MRSRLTKAVIGACAVFALLFVSTGPASAASSATATIGTRTAVGVSNTWNSNSPLLAHDSRISVVARFSNLTSTSAKLTSFQICYQSGPGSYIAVSPYTRNASGNEWGGSSGWWNISKGSCQTWYPNKIYYKQSDGEIVRVISRIGGSISLMAGFYR